jgi:dihydroorotase
LGIPGGTLKEGAAADVTLIDPDQEWVVDPGQFRSKGKNTPFGGCRLQGKAVATLVGGVPFGGEDRLAR